MSVARASGSGRSRVGRSAPAKLNLYLHVTGRRADGYHLLDSLVVFADVGERIDAAPASQLSLTLKGPRAGDLDRGVENLVLRAARMLAAASQVRRGADITLHKTMPVASGIGGGSTDAAAALHILRALWDVDHDGAIAGRLAPQLGADVPVCLAGVPSLVGGIGEILKPAPPLPPAFVVLANPGVPLSTRDVFAALGGKCGDGNPLSSPPPDARSLALALGERRNDLEAPALRLAPEIAHVLAALNGAANCLLARMSGSGATCFGLFAEEGQARAAAGAIGAARPAWWVRWAALQHAPPALETTLPPY